MISSIFWLLALTVTGYTRTISIDDFSRLNRTVVCDICYPETVKELADLVKDAARRHMPVSVAGSLHSQGGHAFCPNGRVISLKNLKNIVHFDAERRTITVQTGITWREVQDFLNTRGYAVKIMQVANVFTIGGALSVNANGIDPHCGPLIESVRSVTIMRADGTLVTASRTENSQLFTLAIGGYGLFGIIVDVTLDIVPNSIYQRTSQKVSLENYAHLVAATAADERNGFHFGIVNFSLNGPRLFKDITAVSYTKVDTSKFSRKKLKRLTRVRADTGPWRYIRQFGLTLLRCTSWAKSFRVPLDESSDGHLRSRNFIMSPPVSQVYSTPDHETDLLQEYFIPLTTFAQFMDHLDVQTRNHGINLLHVELRYIPDNQENVLSYTRGNVIGIVVFFNQTVCDQASHTTQQWTRALIDHAHACGGTYYLPIQLHATPDQVRTVYPRIDEFFALKKQYDPQEVFVNHFYQRYAQ